MSLSISEYRPWKIETETFHKGGKMKRRIISPERMVMGKPRTIMFIKGAAFERRPRDRFTRNKTQSKGKAILRLQANILQKS